MVLFHFSKCIEYTYMHSQVRGGRGLRGLPPARVFEKNSLETYLFGGDRCGFVSFQ